MSEASVEDGEEKSGGGLLKIILIVLVVLLLMVGTAVGTMYATDVFDEKPESEDPEAALLAAEAEMEETDAQLASAKGPMTAEIEEKFVISYYEFEENFQFGLKGGKKMAQAKLGVSTYFDKDTMFAEGEGEPGWVPKHLPGIRAEIGKLLRTLPPEKLESPEGEAEVLEEIRMVINEQLEQHEKTLSEPIKDVFFSSLIVQ